MTREKMHFNDMMITA